MRILLKRWLVYLLLPAGLVLLFSPLDTTLTESIERETVFLRITETLLPPEPAVEEPAAPAGTEETVLQELKRSQAALDAQFSFETTVPNTAGIPVIQKEGFSAAPVLHEAVEDQITRVRLWAQEQLTPVRLEEVPVEEWLSFQTSFTDQGRFQYGNWIFSGHTELTVVSIPAEVNHLKMGCKITGGFCLLLSLLALAGMYASPTSGIRIGKRSAIVMWDVIIVGVTALFMWLAIDMVLHQTLRTEWWGGDQQVGAIGILWILLATPLMAFITTATAIQTLWITQDGIALKGLTGMHALLWPDIREVHLSNIRGPQTATGGLPTKTVMRHLMISGESDSLRILEPPYTSTKKEILQAMEEFAPAELKESLAALKKEWSSLW